MAYEFVEALSETEYRAFLDRIGRYSFSQDPVWGQVKENWTGLTVGLRKDGVLVAAAYLLVRKLAPGLKLMYSPRGFLADWSDEETVRAFTKSVTAFAKKRGIYMLRIDPEIVLSRKDGETEVPSEDGMRALRLLEELGYRHKGFDKDFHTYTQPRYYAEFALKENGKALSDEEILGKYDKKLKKFIGRYTEARGIRFYSETAAQAAEKFVSVSQHTEDRQHILLRDAAYFHRLSEAFGDRCVFFFAEMNLRAFLAFLDTQEQNEQTAADRAVAEEALKEGETVLLAALQTLRAGDTGYLLYSGFNDSVFPRFRTTNQIRYEAMKYFRDCGCNTFSFMGIHGALTDSLSQFKLKFNPTVVEFAGEFEYPVRPLLYKVMNVVLPKAHRVYINVMLFLKGKK